MSLKILIVEDELLIAEMLAEMLKELSYEVVAIAKNYKEALSILNDPEKRIDLALLDINLSSEKDGLDLGLEINENKKIPIIYITSYSDPSIVKKAAILLPESYLVKPFTKTDLLTSIEIVKAKIGNQASPLCIKDGNKYVNLSTKDIFYIKSDKNYLEIFLKDSRYVIRNSMEKLLEEINSKSFVRIHRSYAINIDHVSEVVGDLVKIGENELPLSRKFKSDFKEFLINR